MFARTWSFIKQTAAEWTEDKIPELSAALAFYTALSIAPLLVILLGIVALVFGEDAAQGQIVAELASLMGQQGAQAIQEMIRSANKPAQGIFATVLSVVVLLVGASGVFGQMQASLNTIWGVEPKPGRGIWGLVHDRFLSILMVLGSAFLLLVSLVLSTAISAMGTVLQQLPPSFHWLAQSLNLGISFLVITLLFAMMFKYLPDVKIAWRDVWLGAVITAGLFTIGKYAIGLYLGHSTMASSYGVAGSFVVLLVWVYYSAQIFFSGAEFTQVYASRKGSGIRPAENAKPTNADVRVKKAAG